nr:S41 family peptidase [Luteimonas saliphila]
MRAEAAGGAFERFHDPRDLATALTTALEPQDRHFNVSWSADGAGQAGVRRPAPGPDPARDNFGIRQVQVFPGNVGYLDLRYFADFDFDFDATQPPARQSIDAALQLLAHTDAMVIDLRDNGGGSPAMVGYLASAFVDAGSDIYNTFHSRQGTESEAPARPYASPRTQVPLYVLVSGRTGSAAEAFAYTLKNARRATLVGEATAGAANPGRPFRLIGGFSVFVSTGSPVSPVTGGNWEGSGVAPDVEVASIDALNEARRLALSAIVERGGEDAARWSLEALLATAAPLSSSALDAIAGDYGALRLERMGEALRLRQGRRPPLRLLPLSRDLFFIEGEPTRRVRIERDAEGRVAALEMLAAGGAATRHARGGADAMH